MSAKNSAPPSPAASKASAGAVEEVDVIAAANLPAVLETARGIGWRVLGADAGDGAAPLLSVSSGPPTVLVVGSEGEGLRTTVRRACDGLVAIAGGDEQSGVDSLNVGVAGGILMHHLLAPPGGDP